MRRLLFLVVLVTQWPEPLADSGAMAPTPATPQRLSFPDPTVSLAIARWPDDALPFVEIEAKVAGLDKEVPYRLKWWLHSTGDDPDAKTNIEKGVTNTTAAKEEQFTPGSHTIRVVLVSVVVHIEYPVASADLGFFFSAPLTHVRITGPGPKLVGEPAYVQIDVSPAVDFTALSNLQIDWFFGDGYNCTTASNKTLVGGNGGQGESDGSGKDTTSTAIATTASTTASGMPTCNDQLGLHTYRRGGKFDVTVWAVNSFGSVQNSTVVAVYYKVNGTHILHPNLAEVGRGVRFEAVSFDHTDMTYMWDFGDSHTLITESRVVYHAFNVSKAYFVQVVAMNPVSKEQVWAFVQINPKPPPPAKHTVEIVTPICAAVFSVVGVVFGVAYYRYIYRDRQVEHADFDFLQDTVNSPRRNSAPFSPFRRNTKSYGTTDVMEL
eukprot:m.465679 g.465679  ORF g.465679 m.465679 type:complete len:435 (+) comp20361_c14_seq20:67-1371(+)